MHSKLSILALCAAASVQEVAAGTVHRHLHRKRDIAYAETDTVVVTDYVTVTVTAGEEAATVQAVPTTSEYSVPPVNSVSSSTVSSSSSTSTSASTTSTVAAASPEIQAAEVASPTSTPTTLAVSVKTSSAAAQSSSTSSAVVESSSTLSAPVVYDATTTAQSSTSASSTSTSASASATATSGSSSTKRGAAYNDPSLINTVLGLGGSLSWAYNWEPTSKGLSAEGVTYYPMLWSTASEHSTGFDDYAETAISNGADALLSFNEPDIASQANMSPAAAAAGHIEYFAKYADKVRISSPAISSSEDAGSGIDWLNQFFTACDGKCQVDFCSAHWYGPGGTDGASLFLDHIKEVHEACDNKNVWVTEFAAQSGDVNEFMRTVTKALDSDEYSFVEKYSYFWMSQGSLMDDATSLSEFGSIYAGLTS